MNSSLKGYLKKIIPYGLRVGVRQMLDESVVFFRHRRGAKQVSRFLRALPIKLNLGCGPNRKDGWVNVDLYDPAADLHLDLRDAWPFPDGSVSYIYSEHVFEHFDFQEEVPHFLQEALRVLEPGGIFDVAVPDTEAPLKAYGDPNATFWTVASKMQWHPGCETQLERINYHFRQHGQHKYAWDAETLAKTLQTAGFRGIRRREFDSAMDSAERLMSLYMLAQKPAKARAAAGAS